MYNAEKYLLEAVDSILNQTITNFEFIIIDDASTDSSLSIIQSYNDNRIKIIEKPFNTGCTKSLNIGLAIANGKYIARMDSDDICELNRFEKQITFMEANTNIAVCGTWFKCIGTNEVIKHPTKHTNIKVQLLRGCVIGHPTVFIRNSFLQENGLSYNPAMEPAEDYDLWSRICLLGELANIDEILLNYRVHDAQTSVKKNEQQGFLSQKIIVSLLKILKPDLQEDVLFFSDSIINLNLSDLLFKRLEILTELQEKNSHKLEFDDEQFSLYINQNKRRIITEFLISPQAIKFRYLLKLIINGLTIIKLMGLPPLIKYSIKVLIGYHSKKNFGNTLSS